MRSNLVIAAALATLGASLPEARARTPRRADPEPTPPPRRARSNPHLHLFAENQRKAIASQPRSVERVQAAQAKRERKAAKRLAHEAGRRE